MFREEESGEKERVWVRQKIVTVVTLRACRPVVWPGLHLPGLAPCFCNHKFIFKMGLFIKTNEIQTGERGVSTSTSAYTLRNYMYAPT